MRDGLGLAVGTLTAVPVSVRRVDRTVAGHAMLWAPAVGAALAGATATAGWVLQVLGAGPLLVAVLVLAGMAALTRGLHLDGLADTADGFGCGRRGAEALAVMKASDVGAFGVAALVLTVAVQAAALAQSWGSGRGFAAVVVAAATGRLAAAWACHRLVPPARAEGLGAMVAGTLDSGPLVAVTAATLAGAGLLAWATAGTAAVLSVTVAVPAGVLAGLFLLRRAVARFGGVTGDVLGAVVETATAVALVVAALG